MNIEVSRIDKLKKSFKFQWSLLNWKLLFIVLLTTLIPSIYTTVKIFFINEVPDSSAINIASQISWLNIFYEVIQETLMIPLFFLIGNNLIKKMKKNFIVEFELVFLSF